MSCAEFQDYKIEQHDLIVIRVNGSRDFIARCVLVDQPYEDVAFNDHLMRLKLENGIDSKYLREVLLYPPIRARLLAFIPPTEGGQLTINQKNLAMLMIPVPPLPEQCKIAEILGTWDRAIETLERLIEAKRRLKKGLMQRLLTGRVRFPGFNGGQERRETRFGSLPADWGHVLIEELAHEVSRRNRRGRDLPVLSCTKYDGLVDSLEYFGRQIFSDDTSGYKIVTRGQFAYATNHLEEGSIGYQDICPEALISPMYTVFETNRDVDDRFLYRVLKTERYRHIFEINTNGTVNRRGAIRWDTFSKIRVPLPSLEEQRRIADAFDILDHDVDLLTRKLEALRRQKKGLMQRLLTGRVRVGVQ